MTSLFYQFQEVRSLSWISIPLLHEEALYIIDARNAYLGIWYPSRSCFLIARPEYSPQLIQGRMKWSQHNIRLFEEEHWDMGEPHGTARPFIFIERVPQSAKDNLLAYLLEAGNRLPRTAAKSMVLGRIPTPI